ncbi:hypothetical protein D3C86_1437290 [compost metagenome]
MMASAAPLRMTASTPIMAAMRGATMKVEMALTESRPSPKDSVTKAMTRAISPGDRPSRE